MAHSTKKLGMMFTAAGWILGVLLLVLGFSKILDQQRNPNQSVSTAQSTGYQEIVLQRNHRGHYVFDGEINHQKVTFLVDTGATTTAIPTANGTTTAYLTRLDQLALGDIELSEVNASIIPGMLTDEVLLGMNVLKHFELVQRGDQLIIRRYH